MTAPSGNSLTCWVETLCNQAFPIAARQGKHRPMRAVHHHGLVGRGALLAERVAVVPDGAGVGTRVGGGNC